MLKFHIKNPFNEFFFVNSLMFVENHKEFEEKL